MFIKGVTNPEQRDKQLRKPVFLLSKDFVKGMNLSSGICSSSQIRPYTGKGVAGKISRVSCNFFEIGEISGQGKDKSKACINRMLYSLALKARAGSRVEMLIPHVGILRIRNNLVAVAFDDNLLK